MVCTAYRLQWRFEQRAGKSVGWALVSRNKRAITVDLDDPSGRELFGKLVREADVLIENLTPTLLERWSCDFETLARENPRLIVVSVSCYGRTGPYADRAGAGTLAEAFAGFAHMNGETDGPPMVPSLPLGDTLSGFSGVIGTLMALYARDAGGGGTAGASGGQHVDVSMVEPILQLLALPLVSRSEALPEPTRMGSRVSGGVPRNLYRAKDGHWLALSGTTDSQVARILRCIERDAPTDHARFATSEERLRHADELDGFVAAWIAKRPRAEALEAFHAIRIPVAPVNDLASLLEDPHVQARASVASLEDPIMGRLDFVAPAPKLSGTPGRHQHVGPAIGAHNAEVFSDWLGMTEAEIEGL